LAVEDTGSSGPGAAQGDAGPGSATGQGGTRTTGTGPSGDRTSGEQPPGGESTSTQAGTRPLQAALGQGKRGGRRGRDGGRDESLFAEIGDEDLKDVYVEPDDDYRLALQALERHRVVVLQGKPGSGRHAMARHLLLHALEAERIEAVDPATELGKLKPRQKRSGHILERCPRDQARRLRRDQLAADGIALEGWHGYLVVTVDEGVPVLEGEPVGELLVACAHPPNLRLVLERHLELHLRGRDGLREEDRGWLGGETVRAYLARYGELRLAVRLARDLAKPLAEPSTPDRHQRLDRLLETLEPPEQRAKRQLERSSTVEHWSSVIALAVFEGGEYHAVADAAGLLARRLAPADPRSDTAWHPGPARAGWLEPARADLPWTDGAGLLLRRMATPTSDGEPVWRPPDPAGTDWLELAGGEASEQLEHVVLFNRSPTHRVRFKDPALRAAVLDRVWNELDQLRGPVRDWLDELGGDRDPEVREQVATTVAYLASHGLGYVFGLIIRPWMRRGRLTREAAALALGVLGRDDNRFTEPVLALLSQWSRWGDDEERETAALAYGLAIGQQMPAVALRELRALAMRKGAERPVAEALYELVRRWRHGEVLEAVREWTERPERATWNPAEQRLLRTGLTGFLLATRVYDESGLWPVLITVAEEDPEARKRIVDLWRRALADDQLSLAAGAQFCGWAREADVQTSAGGGQPELVGALKRLVAEVAAGGRADRGRMRQALTRCAKAYDDDGPSAVARQLADHLAEGEGAG
jgi:hypothetical protein